MKQEEEDNSFLKPAFLNSFLFKLMTCNVFFQVSESTSLSFRRNGWLEAIIQVGRITRSIGTDDDFKTEPFFTENRV